MEIVKVTRQSWDALQRRLDDLERGKPPRIPPRARYPIMTGSGGSSGTTLKLFRIEKRKRVTSNPPRWLYYGREVTYDSDWAVTEVSGGFASDGVILSQATPDAGGPAIATPTPGTVLEPDDADEIVFNWPDVTDATNYRITIGTTLDGTDIVNAATTASSTYTLDASLLPGDGSTIYILIESYEDPTWTVNRYTYLDPETTRHLLRNVTEVASVDETLTVYPGVQCNDVRKLSLPAGSVLVPLGGSPPIELVPTGEASTDWSYARNQVIVPFWMATRDSVSVPECREPNLHDSDCFGQTTPEPEDDSLATLVSPAAGATMGSTSVTFTIAGATGATEYWLTIGIAPPETDGAFGDNTYWDVSIGTDTTDAVTGLPDDGSKVCVRVWSKFPTLPYWRHNDYVLTAYTA